VPELPQREGDSEREIRRVEDIANSVPTGGPILCHPAKKGETSSGKGECRRVTTRRGEGPKEGKPSTKKKKTGKRIGG